MLIMTDIITIKNLRNNQDKWINQIAIKRSIFTSIFLKKY